ncbi:putative diphthamide synthesis protein [Leishmania utingensis]|uniref:2-(3-amino-3-carboxypropyl)histidine synthase subunit 1 n=2 Tax=Viannia TaxID=37616 RepID=A0AAW3CDP4_9TRYP
MESLDDVQHDQRQQREAQRKLGLPTNYRFEIDKCIKRIKEKNARRVALQFPEGLLMFSIPIADILEEATGSEMVILGDVTYGACCVDDFSAAALGCDFLIHYGHSCLISIKDCIVANMMYVFVEIDIDVQHFIDTVKALVPADARVACIGTVQFISSMRAGLRVLQEEHFIHPVVIPQNRPLSTGEVLGCTSPKVNPAEVDSVLYVGDGRFHVESFLIAHPGLSALQYDPYKKTLSQETYATAEMRALRREAVEKAKVAQSFAIVMGTLGRQGHPRVVDRIIALAQRHGKRVTLLLMSEIFPQKMALLEDVDCYIQVACPRLSIDWGYAFDRPLLSPYEAEVALGNAQWGEEYPMDHYSRAGGNWAVYTDKSL